MPGYYKGYGYMSKRDESAFCCIFIAIIILAVLAFLADWVMLLSLLGFLAGLLSLLSSTTRPYSVKILLGSMGLLVIGILGLLVRGAFGG